MSFSITQNDKAPRRWRQTLDTINEASARGLSITAQIAARPVGLLLGLELSRNPFQTLPSYKAIAHLPLAERLKRLHQPDVRAAILSETPTSTDDPLFFRPNYDKMFLLGDPPDYEQPPENTLGAQARRQGRQPEELAYEAMLSDEGRGMLYVPFLNYADGNLDATREMLCDPNSVPGLSDGGAHCGIICDASFPTYLLTHWTRDRSRGEKLSIPFVVAAQSRKTALSVGLYRPRRDRARLQGRHQRHRLRQTAPASAEGALRPAGRRPPPAAAGRRLRRHHRVRRGDAAWRDGDRRKAGPAGAGRAGRRAEVGAAAS